MTDKGTASDSCEGQRDSISVGGKTAAAAGATRCRSSISAPSAAVKHQDMRSAGNGMPWHEAGTRLLSRSHLLPACVPLSLTTDESVDSSATRLLMWRESSFSRKRTNEWEKEQNSRRRQCRGKRERDDRTSEADSPGRPSRSLLETHADVAAAPARVSKIAKMSAA